MHVIQNYVKNRQNGTISILSVLYFIDTVSPIYFTYTEKDSSFHSTVLPKASLKARIGAKTVLFAKNGAASFAITGSIFIIRKREIRPFAHHTSLISMQECTGISNRRLFVISDSLPLCSLSSKNTSYFLSVGRSTRTFLFSASSLSV